MVSLTLLEKTLKDHLHGPLTETFNLSLVPKTAPPTTTTAAEDAHSDAMITTNAVPKTPRVTREEANVERLLQIPGIQRLGPLHKSSPPVQLTESETEYTVSVVKHCFAQHIVLQFDCVNTLSDQLLENVKVDLLLPEGYIIRHVIPCAKLVYGEKESTYVILEYPGDISTSAGELIFIFRTSSII